MSYVDVITYLYPQLSAGLVNLSSLEDPKNL